MNQQKSVIKQNLRGMRFTLSEFSGSLGDLGTFIPLTISVALVSGMDIGIILVFAGAFNILTGILFGLPVPVQPMKAIAAVAIAEKLLPGEIAAAGLAVGAVLFLFGATGWVERINAFVPKSVVRGIQLGIGLKLAVKGLEFIVHTTPFGSDSIAMALLLGIAALFLTRRDKVPVALLLFLIGVGVALTSTSLNKEQLQPTLAQFSFVLPGGSMWGRGLWLGALPQLPLTLLNSVIAVCALSGDLFPGRRIGVGKMAVSVGAMNLVSCGFGAMPMCHGSGGLAGQYHFGARTGGSVVMLGTGKLLLGLFFGAAAMQLLLNFPNSVLGLLLFFAGIELARPAADQRRLADFSVMLITVTGILAVNASVGFLFGVIARLLLKELPQNK